MSTYRSAEATIGPVRVAFPRLASPETKQGTGKPQFSVQLLIPKTDTATTQILLDLMSAAAVAAWTDRQPLSEVAYNFNDGDASPDVPEFAGHWRLKVSSGFAPQVVDAHCNPVTDLNKIVSGCWANVCLQMRTYDFPGDAQNAAASGVSASLIAIQHVQDGPKIMGRHDAAKIFKPILGR